MTTALTLARRRGPGLLVVLAAVVIIALAFAIGRAEASGDEYGDSASFTGEIASDPAGDPAAVLGMPDGAIVQIGTVTSGGVGSLRVMFDNNVAYDGTGDDVLVHVLDVDFPATATIEVSADGVTWVSVGDFLDIADVGIDLGGLGLDYAVAVRITNITTDAAWLPGFDVDAVEALNQIDLEDIVLVATPETDENPGFTPNPPTVWVARAVERETVVWGGAGAVGGAGRVRRLLSGRADRRRRRWGGARRDAGARQWSGRRGRAASGRERDRPQPGEGGGEVDGPGPARRQMERELTSRASEPPGESEEPPPERLGRDDPLGQPDPGRPASKVVGDHLDREPGAIGGEATRGQVIEPDAVLEVTDRVLDLGVATMVGLEFERLTSAVGDERVVAIAREEREL